MAEINEIDVLTLNIELDPVTALDIIANTDTILIDLSVGPDEVLYAVTLDTLELEAIN